MSHIGKIANYDETAGTGSITPEKGGSNLPFGRADLQQQGQVPVEKDRYSYEVSNAAAGDCAVKMRKI